MALTLFLLLPDYCIAEPEIPKDCGSSHCGNVTIKYPFRLKSQPQECGDNKLEMECDNHNRTTFMFLKSKLYVQEISYEHHTIHVMDRYHEKLSIDYCSLPINPFVTNEAVSFHSNSILHISLKSPSSVMMLLNCTIPMKSSRFIDASRCASSSSHPASSYFYFLDAETPEIDFNRSCLSISILQIMLENITGLSTKDVYQKLLLGYELEWSYYVRNVIMIHHFRKCKFLHAF
ncbi:hypothetical protein PTKIN_Ptkin14bG0202300 [Pterospermum kingtungense]